MSRDGFRVGDFDPHFPLDDKFMALAAAVPDRRTYFEATGVYWHVVAAAWRDGVRKSATRVAPGATAECIRALQTAELLDGDAMIPLTTFANWVGAAHQRREVNAGRQRAWRHGRETVSTPYVLVTNRDDEIVTTGQDRTGQDSRGGAGGKSPTNGRISPPTDGECRVWGAFLTDKDLCRVGPGWIEHAEHPEDVAKGLVP